MFGTLSLGSMSLDGGGSPGVAAPTAPVLSVVSVVGTDVALSGVIDNTVGEGDSYQVQAQADGGDWSVLIIDDTDTISAGENAADEIDADLDMTGEDAGTYDVRMRVRAGSGPWSDWSNVEEFVIEASATPATLGTIVAATSATDQQTQYTFADMACDVADDSRIIAAAISTRALGTLTSVTIGGVTADLRLTATNNIDRIYLLTAAVPTGTTATVVVNFSGAANNVLRVGVALFPIYDVGSAVPTDTDSSASDPGAVTLTVPANGVAIGYTFSANGASYTWSGLNEAFDGAVESTVIHSAAGLESEAGGDIAMQADAASTPTDPITIFAAWGPVA